MSEIEVNPLYSPFSLWYHDPNNKNWGTGQIQSIIDNKVTVNFENVGKKVINAKIIALEKLDKIE